MNDKIEKKYVTEERRKSYEGTKNEALYLFRQAQQKTKLFAQMPKPQYIGIKKAEPSLALPWFFDSSTPNHYFLFDGSCVKTTSFLIYYS